MFRVLHLTDIHIPPLPRLRVRELLNKRLLGLRSWHRKWKQEHRGEILVALDRALQRISPDHICVTGDLTFTAHPAEIEQAARWLESLGLAESVSVVPGNHDAYVPGALQQALERWAEWMNNDGGATGPFPYLHQRGPLDIIGLSSAIATRLPISVGRLGAGQIERTRALLERSDGDNRTRILLLHHPPQARVARPDKQLLDRAGLCDMLVDQRVELILHGHLHRPLQARIQGCGSSITVLGSGSASALGDRYHPAHFRLLTFADDGTISEEQWQYHRPTEEFAPGSTRVLNRTI